MAVLSRNVRVVGNDAYNERFGAHVYVTTVEENGLLQYGHAELFNVELEKCGQYNTMRFALHFDRTGDGDGNHTNVVEQVGAKGGN